MESRDVTENSISRVSRRTIVAGIVTGALILGLVVWLAFGITHVGSVLMLGSLVLAAAALVFGWRWTARGMARTAMFLLFGGGALIQLQVVVSSLDLPAGPVYEGIVTVPVSAAVSENQAIRPLGETVPFDSAEWQVGCTELWPSGAPELLGGPDDELVGVILLAGADRRRLRPGRPTPPSSNQELAGLRAETVASCLRGGDETLPIHVYTRAPGIEEPGLDDEGYGADRTVQVLGIWEPHRPQEERDLRVALQPVGSLSGDAEPKLAEATRPAPPVAGADSDGVRPVAVAEP